MFKRLKEDKEVNINSFGVVMGEKSMKKERETNFTELVGRNKRKRKKKEFKLQGGRSYLVGRFLKNIPKKRDLI